MSRLYSRKSGSAVWQIAEPWGERLPFASKLGVPEVVAQVLYNRGIDDFEAARRFLQPSLGDLIGPGDMVGMSAAVGRITRALNEREKIVLYGDYDVDGITGVSLLWRCLKLAGVDADYYVPHRLDEGYGLNVQAIEQLAEKGAKLIITVDCGVTAVEPAARAAELGVDLVITDHHKLESELPAAVSILHPNLPGQDYANHDLCGAGVAFKLAWGLSQQLCGSEKVTSEFREFLITATGLVALGTIADVVPLQGENRILAQFGMKCLADSSDLGIRALIEAAGLTGTALQSSDIGFKLAPRLNAAGRMGHARLAVELFTRSGPARAEEIAAYLENLNQQRRKVQNQIFEEAALQVRQLGMDKEACRGIVLAGENWHGGVIGIVASKIVDTYNKPTVILTAQDERLMGSCRSIPGFDICTALEACAENILSFGGHTMAAGLTVEPAKLEALRAAFIEYAGGKLADLDLTPTLAIDAEVDLRRLDMKTAQTIEKLGPFGSGNPEILLAARNLCLVNPPRKMGRSGDHLQFLVCPAECKGTPQNVFRAVAFGQAKIEKKLIDAASFDLAFTPVINRYNGNSNVELMVTAIQIISG